MADDLKNYPNPLDAFRSYSYHFILTVSSTTEALRKQVGEQDRPLYSRVTTAKLGEKIDLDSEDEAYLVLDTRRFSQFSITEFDAEHVYGTGDRNNPSIPFSTTRMKVIDTTGFTFFNFLQTLMLDKVQSTRASAFFLLNIIFIGHRADDESTEVVSSCYMPLLLTTMSAQVDFRGTVVDLEFVETEGGIQRLSNLWQFNHLGTKVTAMTEPGKNSLADLVGALEHQLNWNSLNYFREYINNQNAKNKGTQSASNIPRGKLVQYMFNLPNTWSGSDYKITTAAISRRVEQFFLASGKSPNDEEVKKVEQEITFSKDGESEMSFSEKTTITDALTKILESCEQILDGGTGEKRLAGKAVLFKIAMNITSDKNTYIVHYDIYPYPAPNPDPTASKVRPEVMADKANVIYYDYIFTGKNSHIEDLKITFSPESVIALDRNVNLGTNRMQQMAAAGQREGQVEGETTGAKDDSTGDTGQLLQADPVMPNAITTGQQSNFSGQRVIEAYPNSKARELTRKYQEYKQSMAFFHFLGSINLDVTIRGNPNLLRKFADRQVRGGVAPHGVTDFQADVFAKIDSFVTFSNRVQTTIRNAKALYRSTYYNQRVSAAYNALSSPVPPDWSNDPLIDNSLDVLTYPIFAQINIKTPSVDDIGQFMDGEAYVSDATKFYDGIYRVLFVKHSLIDGDFKQQLNLIPNQSPNEVRNAQNKANGTGKKTI